MDVAISMGVNFVLNLVQILSAEFGGDTIVLSSYVLGMCGRIEGPRVQDTKREAHSLSHTPSTS